MTGRRWGYPRWVWFVLGCLGYAFGAAQSRTAANTAELLGGYFWAVLFFALALWPQRRRAEGSPAGDRSEGDEPLGPVAAPPPHERTEDLRYAEAVQIVYRGVAALPRLSSGVPDPEDVRGAFESGVPHLVTTGVAVEEARTNLRRLIEADAARRPGASGAGEFDVR